MIGRRGRLGLGIGQERVSAVLLAGDRVRWAAFRSREAGTSLTDALDALLAACPRSRLRPPRVIAAVGPAASQLKCLTDLPPLGDAAALAAVVREHAARFFLRNGVPLVMSGARIDTPTSIWIAAFDAPVVADIVTACHRARLPLHAIVPSAIALRWAIDGAAITWADGDVQLAITYGDHGPASVRRVPATTDPVAFPALVAPLATLGDRAGDTLDAAGAARMPRHESIGVHPRDRATGTMPSRRRLVRAGIACALGVALALVSPGLAASLVMSRAHARASVIGPRVRVATREARALAATTAALSELTTRAASRRSMTLLLAEVTRALPDGSALLAFQVDSAGSGSVVAIAPHAAAIVDAVERVPGLMSPEIIGPVTQESVGGRTVERVTVRFRLIPAGAP